MSVSIIALQSNKENHKQALMHFAPPGVGFCPAEHAVSSDSSLGHEQFSASGTGRGVTLKTVCHATLQNLTLCSGLYSPRESK